MKIEDIEAFVAVVRSQSLSRAAHELALTQPILTRRVQGFESELGAALFDRQTKPLRPAPRGARPAAALALPQRAAVGGRGARTAGFRPSSC